MLADVPCSEEVKNVKFSWDGEYIAAAGDDRCIDIVRPVYHFELRQG
jgi:hypothetical protein